MEINFCYINGISRENTPYFSTLSDQISYFTSLTATKVITNTFYPPYYRNNIKVDTADIDLSSNFNYCFFEYNQKYYYYFISNVSYISEDVLSISITMDTIQTYFFDINVHSAVIRRKFIDRYIKNPIDNKWYISRNYIRENISCGIQGKHEIIDLNADNQYDNGSESSIKGWFLIIQSNDINNTDRRFTQTFNDATTPYYITAVPYFGLDTLSKTYYIPTFVNESPEVAPTIEDREVNTQATLAKEGALPNTANIVFINRDILSPYVYAVTEDSKTKLRFRNMGVTKYTTWADKYNKTGAIIISSCYPSKLEQADPNALKINPLASYIRKFTKAITPMFSTRNSDKNKAFSINFVPALLDENYYRISYGDGRAQTEYPLHLLTSPSLQASTYFDYLGNTYYYLSIPNQAHNYFNTIVSCQANGMDLIVSGANSYNAYSKWSIAGALASTAISAGASLLTTNPLPAIGSVLSTASSITGDITSASANATNFSPRGITSYAGSDMGDRRRKYNYKLAPWVGLNSGGYEPGSYNTSSSITEGSDGFSIPGAALHSFTTLTSALTTKANSYSAPSSVRQFTALMQNTAMDNFNTRLETIIVTDIDACAQYYHRYGYLVNEYINPTSHIFSYINTRYYFNYIELAECDIDLSCLQFDSCTSDISSRFYSGIRLWNPIIAETSSGTSITYDIGNYTYDNVERSALNG